MKFVWLAAFFIAGIASMSQAATPVLVIHGGAGVVRAEVTPEREKAVRADLERALHAGYDALKAGATSVEAVTKAIVIMEDSPCSTTTARTNSTRRSWTASRARRVRSPTCIA
jgi:beta-aspartyl-peptidase (threonine type)